MSSGYKKEQPTFLNGSCSRKEINLNLIFMEKRLMRKTLLLRKINPVVVAAVFDCNWW